MSETLRDHMPRIYGGLLPEAFDRPVVHETRATCDDCAMCPQGDAAASSGLDTAFFRPDLKCCTYHPTLPNYLVGAALSDGALAAGSERLRKKIAARIGVTPEWLAAPRKYLVLLDAARDSSFGRSEALLCPYYEKEAGTCTIWPDRESVCATFFCKHAAGATGHAFWTALRRYLYQVECALARYAAHRVCPEVTEPSAPRNRLTREDLEDRPPSPEEYARFWREWVGREEAFYVACAEQVRGLDRGDFERLMQESGSPHLLPNLVAAHQAVAAPELLPVLSLTRDMRVLPAEGGVGVTTYSRYDSLFLTQDLYEALRRFDGKEPNLAVIERLKRDEGIELPASLLLELQVLGVMSAPE